TFLSVLSFSRRPPAPTEIYPLSLHDALPIYQPKAITAATARIWKIQARAWGSVNSEPCRREEVATGIGALSRWPEAPAADNHRQGVMTISAPAARTGRHPGSTGR